MKKLAIIFILALTLTLLAPPAKADVVQQEDPPQQISTSIIDIMIKMKIEDEKLEKEQKLQNRILDLTQHVNKTWYVFSGSTPRGWDCSGMVMWFYSDFGVELEHSATKQMHSGEITTDPVPGDIISFSRNGQNAYHNGIYIGDGMYIHAPKPGLRTSLSSIHTMPEHHWVFTKITLVK
jgi:cell wall-associated NlpC family hydrolase